MIKAGKIYKLFKPKLYTSKKGYPYLRANISDSEKQPDGTWKTNGWYNIMIFGNAEKIYEDGKFRMTGITGVEKVINDVNGKRYENMNLLVNGEPVADGRAEGNYGDAVYDHAQPKQESGLDLGPVSDDGDLPF